MDILLKACIRLEKKKNGKKVKYRPSITVTTRNPNDFEQLIGEFPTTIHFNKHNKTWFVKYQSKQTRQIIDTYGVLLKDKHAEIALLRRAYLMKDTHRQGSHVSLEESYEKIFEELKNIKHNKIYEE